MKTTLKICAFIAMLTWLFTMKVSPDDVVTAANGDATLYIPYFAGEVGRYIGHFLPILAIGAIVHYVVNAFKDEK